MKKITLSTIIAGLALLPGIALVGRETYKQSRRTRVTISTLTPQQATFTISDSDGIDKLIISNQDNTYFTITTTGCIVKKNLYEINNFPRQNKKQIHLTLRGHNKITSDTLTITDKKGNTTTYNIEDLIDQYNKK